MEQILAVLVLLLVQRYFSRRPKRA